jgi:hypothetical protein
MDRRKFLLSSSLGPAAARAVFAEPLQQGERDRALSHLQATRKLFLDTAAPVTEAQWKWKPGPDRWSAEEVSEHIALSEETLFRLVQMTLQKPAAADIPPGQKQKDERIVQAVPKRESKVQAPEMLRPKKTYATKADTLAAFTTGRDRNIAFVRETQSDLRAHLADHPALGPMDCYQWLLMISAHCERHVAQIREVLALPECPKG